MNAEDATYFDRLERNLSLYSLSLRRMGDVRRKPMHGRGPFAWGVFELGSVCLLCNGLHEVTYFVVHAPSGFVIGTGETKGAALGFGRWVLDQCGFTRITQWAETFKAECARAEVRDAEARRLAQAHARATLAASLPAARTVPRRRRAIFEASGGKCHYCSTPLAIEGRWHIEHKMPRALMGGDEPSNLVASCMPCNAKKRDLTDVEFAATLAAAATTKGRA